MRRARLFSLRSIRWTSVGVCFALVLSCLAIVPFGSEARGKRSEASKSNPASMTTRAQDQGQGHERRVDPVPPQPGPPSGMFPNLEETKRVSEQDRRNGGRHVHAPEPIPSRGPRWKYGQQKAEVTDAKSGPTTSAG